MHRQNNKETSYQKEYRKSAISFVLVTEDLVNMIESVNIDENQEHVLTRTTKT